MKLIANLTIVHAKLSYVHMKNLVPFLHVYTQKKKYYFQNLKNSKKHWENSFFESKKHFFELKKVFLIQKYFLWCKEIDFFTLKNIFLNLQNFLWFEETIFCVKIKTELDRLYLILILHFFTTIGLTFIFQTKSILSTFVSIFSIISQILKTKFYVF